MWALGFVVKMAEEKTPVNQPPLMWVLDDPIQSICTEWQQFYTAFTHPSELKPRIVCFASQLETDGCIFPRMTLTHNCNSIVTLEAQVTTQHELHQFFILLMDTMKNYQIHKSEEIFYRPFLWVPIPLSSPRDDCSDHDPHGGGGTS